MRPTIAGSTARQEVFLINQEGGDMLRYIGSSEVSFSFIDAVEMESKRKP